MDKQEAIKILKEFHDTSAVFSVRTALETVFPELKESEDEKIRKAVIEMIHDTPNIECEENYNVRKEDVIAWLEKQGESIKIKKGKNYLCTKTHKYAGVEWIEGVKYYSPEDYSLINQGCTCYCPKYSKEEHNNFFKEAEYDGWLEKQSEKKPVWNEKDDGYKLVALSAFLNYYDEENPLRKCLINWLKSLKQRMGG